MRGYGYLLIGQPATDPDAEELDEQCSDVIVGVCATLVPRGNTGGKKETQADEGHR